jgi:hypothetical protein
MRGPAMIGVVVAVAVSGLLGNVCGRYRGRCLLAHDLPWLVRGGILAVCAIVIWILVMRERAKAARSERVD